MSTKGLLGYRQNNQDYLSLRTSDAYLENGAGSDVIKILKIIFIMNTLLIY